MARKKKATLKTMPWHKPLLASIKGDGNVSQACKAAGLSRKLAYRHRRLNPKFAKKWQLAMDEACDALEAIARQRAIKSSDTLLIFLLKGYRPEVFRELRIAAPVNNVFVGTQPREYKEAIRQVPNETQDGEPSDLIEMPEAAEETKP